MPCGLLYWIVGLRCVVSVVSHVGFYIASPYWNLELVWCRVGFYIALLKYGIGVCVVWVFVLDCRTEMWGWRGVVCEVLYWVVGLKYGVGVVSCGLLYWSVGLRCGVSVVSCVNFCILLSAEMWGLSGVVCRFLYRVWIFVCIIHKETGRMPYTAFWLVRFHVTIYYFIIIIVPT